MTPPYRSSNARYLDSSYGMEAREAIKWSPRDFSFVLQAADCQREADRVGRLLWPYNYSEQEVQEAREKLGTSPLGKGSLTILDSKIGPAAKIDGKDWGEIDWLKFEVKITFHGKRQLASALSDVQIAQVGNAGPHQIQVHFNEVIL